MRVPLPVSRICLSLLLCLLISFHLTAQEPQRQRQTREKLQKDPRLQQFLFDDTRKTPSLIHVKINAAIPASSSAGLLSELLSLRPGTDEMKQKLLVPLAYNMAVQKYQQYYEGIKVEHGLYMVNTAGNIITSLNGAFYDLAADFSTKASLTETAALQKALAFAKPEKMAWQQLQDEIARQPQHAAALRKQMEAYKPKGELVIVKDFRGNTNQLRLAYKFNIYAAQPLYRANVYVDASNGRILLQDMIIKHTDGWVQTRYAGQRTVQTKQVTAGVLGLTDPANGITPYVWTGSLLRLPITNSSFYILHDETRGNGIMTYDMNGVGGLPLSVPALYGQATSFTDPDNSWGDGDALTNNDHKRGTDIGGPQPGGAGEAENDDVAFDAHWGAEMVYDYWKNIHGRLSFDNNNGAIRSYVHYGLAYDNAFWNGEVMTYGDGSGDDNPALLGFKPLTSLDVCGHEIGHGVCEYTANLVYEKESGAMNEAFSDIWAACVENYALTHVDASLPYEVWGIGEQIDVRAGRALRRMNDPNAEGNPDTYGGTFWTNPDCEPNLANDQCGVHNNSGVLNHWFYQLTAGDNQPHVNDLGNTFQVQGLGFAASEKIAYLTELRLSPTATHAEARMVSIQAAIDLFGQCSPQHSATVNAWYAVGVGGPFTDNCAPTITFVSATSSVDEATGGSGCNTQKQYIVFLNKPVGNGLATTINITGGGTATAGKDYSLSTNTVSWTAAQTGIKSFTITILGDAYIEGNESIVLQFATPAGYAAGINTHTITLSDDDFTPMVGAAPITLLTENFESGALPAGWVPDKGTLTGTLNTWTVGDGLVYGNGKAAFITTAGTGVPAYESNTPTDVILRTGKLDARGLSGLTISLTFAAGGESDLTNIGLNPDLNGDGTITAEELAQWPNTAKPFDYGRLVYSFDGESFFDFGDPMLLKVQKQTQTVAIPAAVNGKEFYLGFRWINDANATFAAMPSFVVDDIVVKAMPKAIQTQINKFGEAVIDKNAEAYISSIQDDKLLAKIRSNNTEMGCSRTNLVQSGNRALGYINGLRSEKVFDISGSGKKISYTVTLYFTNEEVAAWGADVNSLKILRTTAADFNLVTNRNSEVVNTAVSNNGGVYYSFTATVSGYGKLCLVKENGSSLLTKSQSASPTEKMAIGVYPNPATDHIKLNMEGVQTGTVLVELIDITGRKVYSQSQRTEGTTFNTYINVSRFARGTYTIRMQNAGKQWQQKVSIR